MSELQVGGTFRLKSGGPIMTLDEVDGDEVICTWFDSKQVRQSGVFKPQTLTPVERQQPQGTREL